MGETKVSLGIFDMRKCFIMFLFCISVVVLYSWGSSVIQEQTKKALVHRVESILEDEAVYLEMRLNADSIKLDQSIQICLQKDSGSSKYYKIKYRYSELMDWQLLNQGFEIDSIEKLISGNLDINTPDKYDLEDTSYIQYERNMDIVQTSIEAVEDEWDVWVNPKVLLGMPLEISIKTSNKADKSVVNKISIILKEI